MKINLIEKCLGTNSNVYEIRDFEKCCDSFTKSRMIVIDNDLDGGIPEALLIGVEEVDYDQFQSLKESINFCPFCGKELKIKIVEHIDYSLEISNLSETIRKLTKQLYAEDSESEQKTLKEQISESREKMSELFRQKLYIGE